MNNFSESKKIFITIMTLFIDEGCHNSISFNRIEKSGVAIQFLLFNLILHFYYEFKLRMTYLRCSLDEEQTEDDKAT
ncbi:hypothetical protein T12_5127 [Trichinella patagoniensis]|uniref:Uncharacterized protein n=1 Tax=Trichinella patagoniensis TaxID=990121 RepID=A0A0V1A5B2_9BILA|nr:hypothetical protein T12_5127 [Trichinella patagoniensis]